MIKRNYISLTFDIKEGIEIWKKGSTIHFVLDNGCCGYAHPSYTYVFQEEEEGGNYKMKIVYSYSVEVNDAIGKAENP